MPEESKDKEESYALFKDVPKHSETCVLKIKMIRCRNSRMNRSLKCWGFVGSSTFPLESKATWLEREWRSS